MYCLSGDGKIEDSNQRESVVHCDQMAEQTIEGGFKEQPTINDSKL